MIYQSERITYHPVMTVSRGKVNDILICRDAGSDRDSYYTLLVLKDHETVKKLIRVMEASPNGYESCLDFFQYENEYCMAFPHVKERKLWDFYMAEQFTLETCMEICENLVLQCMLSKLPFPLLYLAIRQEQLHLLKDNNVELGYTLDLTDLDEAVGEKECVGEVALLVREMLQEKNENRNMGYRLLEMKIPREDYSTLQELYRDLRLTRKASKKRTIVRKFRLWWQDGQSKLFRGFLIFCLILLIFTVACFISKAIWGDVPFLRILFNHFKVIGTESLVS